MKDAAMPVGPVHHRGNGKAVALVFQVFVLQISTVKRTQRQNSLSEAGEQPPPYGTKSKRLMLQLYVPLLRLNVRSPDHLTPPLDLSSHVCRCMLRGTAVGLRG